MKNEFKIIAVILATGLLVSCAVSDPVFLKNSGKISDTNYPANKIVGTWAHVWVSPVHTSSSANERKLYLNILPNGNGRVRDVSRNLANGGHLSAEAPLTWRYEGKNWWRITLPALSAYRVTDSYRMSLAPGLDKKASDVRVRYFEGNLYDFRTKQVFVPANAQSVSELANRMRRETPIIKIDASR